MYNIWLYASYLGPLQRLYLHLYFNTPAFGFSFYSLKLLLRKCVSLQRNSQSSDYRNCEAEKQRSRKRCQAVFEAGRVHACASRVSRAVHSFPSSARLKLRTTSSKRCDTCTNLHTGSTGVCLTRPRGQIYARRCLSTRVHVYTRAATFKSLDLAARSLFLSSSRSIDRPSERVFTEGWLTSGQL